MTFDLLLTNRLLYRRDDGIRARMASVNGATVRTLHKPETVSLFHLLRTPASRTAFWIRTTCASGIGVWLSSASQGPAGIFRPDTAARTGASRHAHKRGRVEPGAIQRERVQHDPAAGRTAALL